MATLIGLFTLGRDAELRATQGGDDVAGLALAYNYGRRDQGGKQPTQWIDAALWGDRGVKLQQWLVKGAQFLMHIEDVHVETYDKRDGGLSFGRGAKADARMDWHSGLLELAEQVRTMLPAPPTLNASKEGSHG